MDNGTNSKGKTAKGRVKGPFCLHLRKNYFEAEKRCSTFEIRERFSEYRPHVEETGLASPGLLLTAGIFTERTQREARVPQSQGCNGLRATPTGEVKGEEGAWLTAAPAVTFFP